MVFYTRNKKMPLQQAKPRDMVERGGSGFRLRLLLFKVEEKRLPNLIADCDIYVCTNA